MCKTGQLAWLTGEQCVRPQGWTPPPRDDLADCHGTDHLANVESTGPGELRSSSPGGLVF